MIGRRRPQPKPEPVAEATPEVVLFTSRPTTCGEHPLPTLRRYALGAAREFFGPDYELAIVSPWTASRDTGRYTWRAEIVVTGTPRSAK